MLFSKRNKAACKILLILFVLQLLFAVSASAAGAYNPTDWFEFDSGDDWWSDFLQDDWWEDFSGDDWWEKAWDESLFDPDIWQFDTDPGEPWW